MAAPRRNTSFIPYSPASVRGWLEWNKSSTESILQNQNAVPESGDAEELYAAVLQVFQQLWSEIRSVDAQHVKKYRKQLKADLEKFILWGDGFRNGRLDQALTRSEYLKVDCLTVLIGVAKLLLSSQQKLSHNTLPRQQGQRLQELIERATNALGDVVSDDEEVGTTDTGNSSDDSHASSGRGFTCHRIKQFSKDISCYISSLMDTIFSIEQTLQYAEMDSKKTRMPDPDSFEVADPAQVYVHSVQDKFPAADLKLVRRLGQANWERHHKIRHFELEEIAEPLQVEEHVSIFKPNSIFHDSGLGISNTSVPGRNSSSAISVASRTSFASSVVEGDDGSLRVPPMPEAAKDDAPFLCRYCNSIVEGIKTRIAWKVHVFSDLKPYICTMSSCDGELVTFSDRGLWAEHEFNMHRMKRTWSCPECSHQSNAATEWTEHLQVQHKIQPPSGLLQVALDAAEIRKELPIQDQVCPFCQTAPSTTRREFVKHVGRHMEEVALTALPLENHSDNSDTVSSTGSYFPGVLETTEARLEDVDESSFAYNRNHTAGQLVSAGDEYVPRDYDEAGEKKVTANGHLDGNHEYRCRTFLVPNRGQKLFMLATECARVLGYRDSYLLFSKNRSLHKIIATQAEKEDLITQDILPFSYRSRQMAIVTAYSMYRQFGSRMIINGRRVRDDYWESTARNQGFTEEDLADEKRPGGAKVRDAAAAEASATSSVVTKHDGDNGYDPSRHAYSAAPGQAGVMGTVPLPVMGGHAGSDDGTGEFEFGIDPSIDPELVLGVRMSMNEEAKRAARFAKAKEEQKKTQPEPNSILDQQKMMYPLQRQRKLNAQYMLQQQRMQHNPQQSQQQMIQAATSSHNFKPAGMYDYGLGADSTSVNDGGSRDSTSGVPPYNASGFGLAPQPSGQGSYSSAGSVYSDYPIPSSPPGKLVDDEHELREYLTRGDGRVNTTYIRKVNACERCRARMTRCDTNEGSGGCLPCQRAGTECIRSKFSTSAKLLHTREISALKTP